MHAIIYNGSRDYYPADQGQQRRFIRRTRCHQKAERNLEYQNITQHCRKLCTLKLCSFLHTYIPHTNNKMHSSKICIRAFEQPAGQINRWRVSPVLQNIPCNCNNSTKRSWIGIGGQALKTIAGTMGESDDLGIENAIVTLWENQETAEIFADKQTSVFINISSEHLQN